MASAIPFAVLKPPVTHNTVFLSVGLIASANSIK
jgi:hypothetical protein